jgi:hypothetical protein
MSEPTLCVTIQAFRAAHAIARAIKSRLAQIRLPKEVTTINTPCLVGFARCHAQRRSVAWKQPPRIAEACGVLR